MIHKAEKCRWLGIFTAVVLLAGMVLYAYLKAPEIRSLAYRIDGNYVTSNGSEVLDTLENAFTIKWQYGQPKTFIVQSTPPFNVGEVVAFKLDVGNHPGVLEEYHVWESQSIWYTKLFISVVPLVFVVIVFFRDFRASWGGRAFLRKT